MKAGEIAAQVAGERPGMTLLDFAEVGLPYWRILARCDVLAKKPLSAIDETVLRAISLGVQNPTDLQLLLGLQEPVFEGVIVGLLGEGWIEGAPEQPVALTEAGTEALGAAVELVSEERVVPFYYDGLLRRPVAIDDAIEPRRARDLGIREVPPAPSRPPDIAELRKCRGDLVRILRTLRDGRDQETELLAIRGWDRRDRVYRPAIAMVFMRESGRGIPQLAFAIDGKESVDHEAAFASGGQIDRLGIVRALRSRRKSPLLLPGPKGLRDALRPQAEQAARDRIHRAEQMVDNAGTDRAPRRELRRARRELGSLSPRSVSPHEHQALLEYAIQSSQSQLLIRGGELAAAHVDLPLVDKLRAALERGARIWVATQSRPHGVASKALQDLAKDYSHMSLEFDLPERTESVLISDELLAIQGGYPWLGHLGDARRPLGDCRSILTTDSEWIKELAGRLMNPPTPRRDKPRRRGKASAS